MSFVFKIDPKKPCSSCPTSWNLGCLDISRWVSPLEAQFPHCKKPRVYKEALLHCSGWQPSWEPCEWVMLTFVAVKYLDAQSPSQHMTVTACEAIKTFWALPEFWTTKLVAKSNGCFKMLNFEVISFTAIEENTNKCPQSPYAETMLSFPCSMSHIVLTIFLPLILTIAFSGHE